MIHCFMIFLLRKSLGFYLGFGISTFRSSETHMQFDFILCLETVKNFSSIIYFSRRVTNFKFLIHLLHRNEHISGVFQSNNFTLK
jgi:hypothetical protein